MRRNHAPNQRRKVKSADQPSPVQHKSAAVLPPQTPAVPVVGGALPAPAPVADPGAQAITTALGQFSAILAEMQGQQQAQSAQIAALQTPAIAPPAPVAVPTVGLAAPVAPAPAPAAVPAPVPAPAAAPVAPLPAGIPGAIPLKAPTDPMVEARIRALEAAGQVPGAALGALQPGGVKSGIAGYGDAVHASDHYKSGWGKESPEIGVLGAKRVRVPSLFIKSTDPLAAANLGALVLPYYSPEIVRELKDLSSIARLIPSVGLNGATVHNFRKETSASRFGYIYSKLAAVVTSGVGPDATFETVEGFVLGTVVRFNTTADGITEATISAIDTVTKIVTFTATLNLTGVIGDIVASTVYGAIPEAGQKAHSLLEFELITVTLKTLPILMAVTMQSLNSIPQLQSFAEADMRERFTEVLSYHLLYGNGTVANQLPGFWSEPDAQTYSWSSGIAGDTLADAVIRAAANIPGRGQKTVVLNQVEWNKVILAKASSNGHYILGGAGNPINVVNTVDRKELGDMIVEIDAAVKPLDFLVADFSKASEIADQERASFAVGYINTDFIENNLRFRHEETLTHAIKRTSAFILGEFDAAPS